MALEDVAAGDRVEPGRGGQGVVELVVVERVGQEACVDEEGVDVGDVAVVGAEAGDDALDDAVGVEVGQVVREPGCRGSFVRAEPAAFVAG
ncbi:hypothetical protein [Streptomyces tritici]|uniref:hypothetical protein n=1 Tax=Streptomyces tritici TaxID=2054410 RepID=UPI003AEF5003